nr:MAG TPA: PGDYG protein [Bacteriophage sp.]
MINKYRKKPVIIEAIQWNGKNLTFMGGTVENKGTTLVIHTLEGDMEASINDYIIKGVNGEFYPCKPDIFDKSYERAQ